MASTSFAKSIKMKLVDLDKSQKWLIEQVSARTGLYFDDSYLSKIMRGVNKNRTIISAIREILDIGEEEAHGERAS